MTTLNSSSLRIGQATGSSTERMEGLSNLNDVSIDAAHSRNPVGGVSDADIGL
jgi:hypothetical protein